MKKEDLVIKLQEKAKWCIESRKMNEDNMKRKIELVAKIEVYNDVILEIKQLEQPGITEEQAWNKIAESYPADVRSLVTSFQNFYYGDFIKNPTISKKETVEIPEAIAKYIRSQREIGFDLQQTFYQVHTSYKNNELNKAEEWVDENQGEFATAWLDGYAITPENKMQITVKSYDKTELKIDLPEKEAKKLIDKLKKNPIF